MVTREERRWAFICASALFLLTSLPYLMGFWSQGSHWVYTGFVFGVEDGNSYIAKMLTGSMGSWLFRTPYTAYPQNGALAFLPYILLGKLAAVPGLHVQLVVLFHLFRLMGALFMVIATYWFIAFFIPDISLRRFGTLLAVCGGGLGWISIFGLNQLFHWGLPLEFYSPETFGFMSLLGLPHLALGRGLLLIGLLVYLGQSGPGRTSWLAGSIWFILGLVQPLTVVVGWTIIAVHLIILGLLYSSRTIDIEFEELKRFFKKGAGVVLVSSPVALYTFIAFSVDPYLQLWGKQNIITSPPPFDYLMAYLPVLPFVIIAMIQIVKSRNRKYILILGWVLIIPILAYLPYNLQRRLPEGSWVAMVALAMFGLTTIDRKVVRWIKAALWSTFLPTIILFSGCLIATLTPQYPLFVPVEELNAFEAINSLAKPGDAVVASFDTSNRLPAWVPVRTLIGHGPESIHLSEIQPRVEGFYKNDSSFAYEQLLREFQVKYVYLGPDEKKLGGLGAGKEGAINDWLPVKRKLIHLVYNQGGIQIFRVSLPAVHDSTKK